MSAKSIFSHITFLRLKNGKKWVLLEWMFEFRRHFLRHTKFCDQQVLKKKKLFLNLGLKVGVCVITLKTHCYC